MSWHRTLEVLFFFPARRISHLENTILTAAPNRNRHLFARQLRLLVPRPLPLLCLSFLSVVAMCNIIPTTRRPGSERRPSHSLQLART